MAGASAYPRVIDFPRMAEIAHSVGALLMVDMAHIAGLVAAGSILSPALCGCRHPTTHKTLRGPRGGPITTNNEDIAKKGVNKAIFPGIRGGPLEHIIAAKAVCFGRRSSRNSGTISTASYATPARWQMPCWRRVLTLFPAEPTTI